MQEPQDTVENALYGAAWDEKLPSLVYRDIDGEDIPRIDKEALKGQLRDVWESARVDNTTTANKYIRRLRVARENHAADLMKVSYELGRIKSHEKNIKDRHLKKTQWFESLLRDYAHDELAKTDGKERSIALSEGTVQFTKRQPKLTYDDKALIQELEDKDLEKLIRRKAEPNLVEIKQAIKGGVVLDSITVEEQADSFKVSVNE